MEQIVLRANKNVCEIDGWQSNTGEVNARELRVELCECMQSCDNAFITFKLADGTVYESKVKDGKAEIPVIDKPQFIEIGVYSADIENGKCVKRYSPHPVSKHVNMGSFRDNGSEQPLPTPGTFEDLLEELGNKLDHKDVITEYDPEMEFSADTVFSTNAVATILELIEFFLEGLSQEKESNENKVTEITEDSTNVEYPSAKAVYDYVQSIMPPSAEGVEY